MDGGNMLTAPDGIVQVHGRHQVRLIYRQARQAFETYVQGHGGLLRVRQSAMWIR